MVLTLLLELSLESILGFAGHFMVLVNIAEWLFRVDFLPVLNALCPFVHHL